MSRTNQILAVALLIQAGLAVFMLSGTTGRASTDANVMLDLSADDITELVIEAKPRSDGKVLPPLDLKKQGDGWVVASAGGYPAKIEKIKELTTKLATLKVREPIATNAANHNALNVGEQSFAKKVKIVAGQTSKSLIVGSAKGSSIHARFADQDNVYLARGLSAFALSERPTTYVDTQYVKVDDASAITVTNPGGTIHISKAEGGHYVVQELPADADVDDSRVKSFVNSATNVQLAEPVGKEIKPEYGLDGSTKVEITAGEKTVSYVIGALKDEKFYVKADNSDFVVLVSKWAVESLQKQTPDKFIKEQAAPTPPGGGPGGMQLPPGMKMPPGMQPPR